MKHGLGSDMDIQKFELEHKDITEKIMVGLKATGVRVGLLINFGRTRVEFKRLVF